MTLLKRFGCHLRPRRWVGILTLCVAGLSLGVGDDGNGGCNSGDPELLFSQGEPVSSVFPPTDAGRTGPAGARIIVQLVNRTEKTVEARVIGSLQTEVTTRRLFITLEPSGRPGDVYDSLPDTVDRVLVAGNILGTPPIPAGPFTFQIDIDFRDDDTVVVVFEEPAKPEPEPEPEPQPEPENNPPIAVAGDDQVVSPGAPVALDGSASSDPDGDALSFTWTQTAGANPVTLNNANSSVADFIAPSTGDTLVFRLDVSDGDLSDSDVVAIAVISPPAPPPPLPPAFNITDLSGWWHFVFHADENCPGSIELDGELPNEERFLFFDGSGNWTKLWIKVDAPLAEDEALIKLDVPTPEGQLAPSYIQWRGFGVVSADMVRTVELLSLDDGGTFALRELVDGLDNGTSEEGVTFVVGQMNSDKASISGTFDFLLEPTSFGASGEPVTDVVCGTFEAGKIESPPDLPCIVDLLAVELNLPGSVPPPVNSNRPIPADLLPAATVYAGESLTVATQYEIRGSNVADDFEIGYRLLDSPDYPEEGQALDSQTVPVSSGAPLGLLGVHTADEFSVTIPCTIAPGFYYVVAEVDSGDDYPAEYGDEPSNNLTSSILVEVLPPQFDMPDPPCSVDLIARDVTAVALRGTPLSPQAAEPIIPTFAPGESIEVSTAYEITGSNIDKDFVITYHLAQDCLFVPTDATALLGSQTVPVSDDPNLGALGAHVASPVKLNVPQKIQPGLYAIFAVVDATDVYPASIGEAEFNNVVGRPTSVVLLDIRKRGNGAAPNVTIGERIFNWDFDGDDDVDGLDFCFFRTCLSGADVPHPPGAKCDQADGDGDGDVDQTDFGFLQACFSGDGVTAPPECLGQNAP